MRFSRVRSLPFSLFILLGIIWGTMILAGTPCQAQQQPALVSSHWRSDLQAAKRVHGAPETRSKNVLPNHRKPTNAQLTYFRQHSDMPYAYRVTGAYTGTTDEIIQWAAAKWGFHPNLLRAVATTETWWHNEFVGDDGDSFGLFQMRRPYHCCLPFMGNSTAFNADYYGGILRAYYDGKQSWLNTVTGNGKKYRSGDIWGAVGAWCSGRWHDARAETYIVQTKGNLRRKTWLTSDFLNG